MSAYTLNPPTLITSAVDVQSVRQTTVYLLHSRSIHDAFVRNEEAKEVDHEGSNDHCLRLLHLDL
jgi:hypothetical protein